MNLVVNWNNIALEGVRALGQRPFSSADRNRGGPPQVARTLGIVYTVARDVWAACDDVARPRHRSVRLDQTKQVMDAQTRLAPEQKVIADYWFGAPRSEIATWALVRVHRYVAERDHLAFDDSVKLFFAVALRKFTGSDRFGFFYTQDVPLKADPTEPVTDVVLSWPTFSAAARQAGESRLYGGIHFYEGNVVGLDIGEKVGELAYNRAQDLWSGA